VEFLSVASEFFINSQNLEDKVRQLLPSQGGAGAGFDLSASTQIVPVINLTETAEGSILREDLQRSFSHSSVTFTTTTNTTNTIISNTGYFTINFTFYGIGSPSTASIAISDGATSKEIKQINSFLSGSSYYAAPYSDVLNVFLTAGDSVTVTTNVSTTLTTATRQIAAIDGTLVNP
jgi:hypothetical protein